MVGGRRHDQLHEVRTLSPSERTLIEYTKDSWNAENLVGIRYPDTATDRWIHFGKIPAQFRPLVKQWCQFLLARFSFTHCGDRVLYLQFFLNWFVEYEPTVTTFADLTAAQVDAYIAYCKITPNTRGRQRSDDQIWRQVHALRSFLEYLELNTHPLRTQEPVQKVVGPHHGHYLADPLLTWTSEIYSRGSPAAVRSTHPRSSSPLHSPVYCAASISDVLLLKTETCLERTDKGWWICGDISKTQVLGHRVPITKEVAEVIMAQQASMRQESSVEVNPKGYLFLAPSGPRRKQGKPMTSAAINEAFQRLACQYEIKGENGKLFHFHTHAFRHSKAVELLNNGMSLVMVQQWMAHASPEMTLIYAKILDDTMHKQWEQTMKQGAVYMGPEGGKPQRVEGRKVLEVLSSNALDVERVREHRIAVKLPIGNCCKTPKIICRFVELPCFNCPAYVLTPDDLPALEAYAEQVRQRIDIGKKAGQAHWVEANQGLLEQKVLPSIALLQQGQTVAKEDKYVREYTPEEWAERQVSRQQEESA
jgi:integrase